MQADTPDLQNRPSRRARPTSLWWRFAPTLVLPLLGRFVPDAIGANLPRGSDWWPVSVSGCDVPLALILATVLLGPALMVTIAAGAPSVLSSLLRSVAAFAGFLVFYVISGPLLSGADCGIQRQAAVVISLAVLLAVACARWIPPPRSVDF